MSSSLLWAECAEESVVSNESGPGECLDTVIFCNLCTEDGFLLPLIFAISVFPWVKKNTRRNVPMLNREKQKSSQVTMNLLHRKGLSYRRAEDSCPRRNGEKKSQLCRKFSEHSLHISVLGREKLSAPLLFLQTVYLYEVDT